MSELTYLKEELSDKLEVSIDLVEDLFGGCSYLGESIPHDYEDQDFVVRLNTREVDEDIILEYANNHPNPRYDLYDDEDLVILEEGEIYSKSNGTNVKYTLNTHRHVVKEGGKWRFTGMISVEYWNVA